jgi:hypothetical protein
MHDLFPFFASKKEDKGTTSAPPNKRRGKWIYRNIHRRLTSNSSKTSDENEDFKRVGILYPSYHPAFWAHSPIIPVHTAVVV